MTHFSLTSVRAVLVVYSVVAGWSMGGVAADNHDHNNTSGTVIGFRNETLTSVLPESLSDMTAVLDATNAKVYIHGGCNAPLGNVYNAEFEFYGCDSLSNATHVFDLETRTFDDVPASMTMPVARYRHAAVLVQGQIWIVGGRNLTDDALVETIDVRA